VLSPLLAETKFNLLAWQYGEFKYAVPIYIYKTFTQDSGCTIHIYHQFSMSGRVGGGGCVQD
jgi:hypothetical protein